MKRFEEAFQNAIDQAKKIAEGKFMQGKAKNKKVKEAKRGA